MFSLIFKKSKLKDLSFDFGLNLNYVQDEVHLFYLWLTCHYQNIPNQMHIQNHSTKISLRYVFNDYEPRKQFNTFKCGYIEEGHFLHKLLI